MNGWTGTSQAEEKVKKKGDFVGRLEGIVINFCREFRHKPQNR